MSCSKEVTLSAVQCGGENERMEDKREAENLGCH